MMHKEDELLKISESTDQAILDTNHKEVAFIRSESVHENQNLGEIKSILPLVNKKIQTRKRLVLTDPLDITEYVLDKRFFKA